MNKVFIRKVDISERIRGLLIEDNEGNYNIYISSYLPSNKVVPTLIHELKHCKHIQDETLTVEQKEYIANE